MKGFLNLTHTNNARVDRKIDKLANGTFAVGNIPKITATGELEDSGYKELIHIISNTSELSNVDIGYTMLYVGIETTYNGVTIKSNKIYRYQRKTIQSSNDQYEIIENFFEVLDYLTSSEIQTIVNGLDARINDITILIPSQASSSNQLADKNFVNSSISTATATFKGSYNLVTDLNLTTSATHNDVATALASTISSVDNNDYCFVQVPTSTVTPTSISQTDRYKYSGSAWAYEYTLNTSGFTASQWEAINSGATSQIINSVADKVDKTTTIAGVDLQDNITDTELRTALNVENGAQVNTITSVNTKTGAVVLDPDDLSDTNTTNKFVTASEKSTWSGKQDAISSTNKLSSDLVDDTNATNLFVTSGEKSTWNNKASKVTIADYTLLSTGWSSNSYTLSVTGKTANNHALVSNSNTGTNQEVLANAEAISDANIYKITDNGTSLTFTCETTPTTDLKITIEVYE